MPDISENRWLLALGRLLKGTRLIVPIVFAGKKLYENSTGKRFREFDFHALGQSHIDAAWRWTRSNAAEICRETFDKALRHIEEYPRFTFLQPSPQYYEWMKKGYPDLYERIKAAEKGGRWFIIGGMWVEADVRIPSGESLVRQRLYGQRFYKSEFGRIAIAAFLPDSFGFPNSLPQILKKSGARIFITHKLLWNSKTIFPFANFLWKGCDGTKIPTHIADVGYTLFERWKTHGFQRLLVRQNERLVANYTTPDSQIKEKLSEDYCKTQSFAYGAGDGGHGPLDTELLIVDALDRLGDIHYSNPKAFIESMLRESDRFPVWEDELYLELHRGTLTTQGWIKKKNRRAEEFLGLLEFVCTLSYIYGGGYPREEIRRMWRMLLFNQFHDILSGSSIPEVYDDVFKDFLELQDVGEGIWEKYADEISRRISYKKFDEILDILAREIEDARSWGRMDKAEVLAISIFNPKSIDMLVPISLRLVELGKYLSEEPNGEDLLLVSSSGRIIDHQLVIEHDEISFGRRRITRDNSLSDEDRYAFRRGRSILFATRVPSLGYETIYVVRMPREGIPSSPGHGEEKVEVRETNGTIIMENTHLRVEIDGVNGDIGSIYSKALEASVSEGQADRFLLFENHPRTSDAWNIAEDYKAREIGYPAPIRVEVTEHGPVRYSIEIAGLLNESPYVKRISLYSCLDGLYMDHLVQWQERHKLLKIAFPLAFKPQADSITTADTPYGMISRRIRPKTERDRARWEISCQKWINAGPDHGKYSFTLVNDGRYGYNVDENSINLTFLRSPKYPKPSEEVRGLDRKDPNRPQYSDTGEMHYIRTALFATKGTRNDGASSSILGEKFNARFRVHVQNLSQISPSSGEGGLPDSFSFASSSNPAIGITAVKAPEADMDEETWLMEKGRHIVLRLFNYTEKHQKTNIRFNGHQIAGIAPLDLLEFERDKVLHDFEVGEGSFAIKLQPFEIETLRVELG